MIKEISVLSRVEDCVRRSQIFKSAARFNETKFDPISGNFYVRIARDETTTAKKKFSRKFVEWNSKMIEFHG